MTLETKALAHNAVRLQELKDTKVGTLSLEGNRATVVLADPARGLHDVELVETSDGWRISKQLSRVRKPIGG
jgi:hypothetical protein